MVIYVYWKWKTVKCFALNNIIFWHIISGTVCDFITKCNSTTRICSDGYWYDTFMCVTYTRGFAREDLDCDQTCYATLVDQGEDGPCELFILDNTVKLAAWGSNQPRLCIWIAIKSLSEAIKRHRRVFPANMSLIICEGLPSELTFHVFWLNKALNMTLVWSSEAPLCTSIAGEIELIFK